MSRNTATSVSVVGGGIAGLAAAYELQQAGIAVTVYEASDRWGGKIFSSPVGDRLVDAGPDTFLARAPEGVQLCAELGLQSEMVAPISPVPAYIHRDQQLLALPEGTILGIPTNFDAVAASGLVSADGIERAKQDLDLPRTIVEGDCSLGWYCRQRLGDEVAERLVDPLLGGINASNIDDLSMDAAFPALAKVARSSRSLIECLRERQATVGATLGSESSNQPRRRAPVFYSLPGGMSQLVDRLVDTLGNPRDKNTPAADLRLNSPVEDLDQLGGSCVILATPASRSSRILSRYHPKASAHLRQISYTSVSQVTFEFPRTEPAPTLDASGILFPQVDGLIATAATWLSTKWSRYASDDQILIRVSSGRANDTRSSQLTDHELQERLLAELATVVKIGASPTAVRVQRWTDAFPQYSPGHRELIQNIYDALASGSGSSVRVAGAAYDGIGIPACIRSGRQAAQAIIEAEQG